MRVNRCDGFPRRDEFVRRATPVDVLDEANTSSGMIDECRAMAQLVHDLAPDARPSFATAFDGFDQFANNIRNLETAGSNVIVDDVSYYTEPYFQNGPIGVAVDDVTAAGATYYSSAANSNVIVGGKDVSSWEAPAFRLTASCPAFNPPVAYVNKCMDFNPSATTDSAFSVTVANNGGFYLDLQWAEPWYGVATDLDVYVIDAAGIVRAASENCNIVGPGCAAGSIQPYEFLGYGNTTGTTQTVRIVINRYGGAASPCLKFVLLQASGITSTEYNQSGGGDIVGFGHNGAQNAMSSAAVPYNNSSMIETYSSRGPVTYYFGPVVGTTPAAALPSPLALNKPDISATDGGQTTFFYGTVAPYRFYGTSAAAPHAAGVAALQLDGFPGATVTQVKNAQKTTAAAVGSFGANAAGAGLINALAAVSNLLPGATISDVSATEGNSGTKTFTFTVTLSKTSAATIKIKYATKNGTATAASDYVAKNGTVTFNPGQTSKTIVITVNGDSAAEPNETFTVQLKKPIRANLVDKIGQGTIQNDD